MCLLIGTVFQVMRDVAHDPLFKSYYHTESLKLIFSFIKSTYCYGLTKHLSTGVEGKMGFVEPGFQNVVV